MGAFVRPSNTSRRLAVTVVAAVACAAALAGIAEAAPASGNTAADPVEAPNLFFDGTIEEALLDPEIAHALETEPVVIISVTEESMSPMSASGTNGDVTIRVTGTGLKVDAWRTEGKIYPADGHVCSTASFTANGINQETSPQVCGQVPALATHSVMFANAQNAAPRHYLDGTQLCNTWSSAKIAGKPCITVKR